MAELVWDFVQWWGITNIEPSANVTTVEGPMKQCFNHVG